MKNISRSILAAAIAVAMVSPATAAENYSALFKPVARGDQSTESVYFVMTDRFANGDTSNDGVGYNPADISYWHGGDFKGLTSKLDYIQSMGFTAIWITPPVVQQAIQGDSAAYHGYWALDFMHIDPHLGTEADFKAFVDAAHAKGMKVIVDVVANHTADVIAYSNGVAYLPADKENLKNPAFLNNINNYHNQGPSTFEGESAIVGDFFGLDDIATDKPEVVQGFIDIWSYWITHYNIDGFRIDTFKHVNPEFWLKVIPAIQKVAQESGKKTFPIFGEVYDSAPENLSTYVASGQTPSVLDFGFNEQVTRYTASFGQADRLARFFNLDDLYTTPTTSAYGLATFTGNHDMGRVGMTLLNNATNRDTALALAKTHQAALFLLRGGPVLYYGDEHGMTGSGGDKAARQDMFPTQVARWTLEQRIGEAPIESLSSFDVTNPIANEISKIQAIIAAHPALRNGTQQTIYARGQQFAVTRYANGQEYIVAFNTADETKKFTLTPLTKKSQWTVLAGSCTATSAPALSIEKNSYCLLKANSKIGKSATTKVSAPKLGNSNDSPLWKEISVTVNSPGYNQVSFSARTKGGTWKSLGTSDRTTFETDMTVGNKYRVFLRPTDFKRGAQIEIIAVVKTSDGKIIASSITKAMHK